jgi:hypothetical protein
VCKGAVLDVSHPLLGSTASENIERAMQIYDARQNRPEEFSVAGLGLVPVKLAHLDDIKTTTHNPAAILAIELQEFFPLPVRTLDGAGGIAAVTVEGWYLPQKLFLDQVLTPISEHEKIPAYLPEMAALIQLLVMLPAICDHLPWALSSLIRRGYVCASEEQLADIVSGCLPDVVRQLSPFTPNFEWPANFAEWRDSLRRVSASVWPLRSGHFLHRYHNELLIDVCNASHALLHRLEFRSSTAIGNLRGDKFELQCQAMIDATPWVPLPLLKNLRGRKLEPRAGVKYLTDIDAIGAKDGSVLLVSCKSIIYGREYDQGECSRHCG